MFRPLAIYIGLRYTRAKRRNHFISFISLASMIGIALGITVLITVLSVMNGFDYQIKNRLFSMAPQVTITNSENITSWSKLAKHVEETPTVVNSAPFVSGQGMVSSAGVASGVFFTGILPKAESLISTVGTKMLSGKMESLTPDSFGIVIGADLAAHLGVSLGDKIVLIIPEVNMTPIGLVPRYKRCTVVGVFQTGGNDGLDSGAVFLHLNDAQKLLQLGNKVTGLRIKVKDLYDAPKVSTSLREKLPETYSVSDWTENYGTLFKAIQMEKRMMFIILLFIIAVATFNLVSSLVMAVNDKQADIAILRTLGASPKTIMGIFMVQGTVIGLFGTILGVIGGILLAINAPYLVNLIETLFHVKFISSSIYFIDYLPSKLELADVVNIALISLFMSLLATLYPAWRAAKTNPAEALRYD